MKYILILSFSLLISSSLFSQNFIVSGNHVVCIGDTTIINIQPINDSFYVNNSSSPLATKYIPDDSDGISGNGISDSINLDIVVYGFSSNDSINTINDIHSVCLDIEHSNVGDVDIKLISPNGLSVFLVDMNPPLGPTSDFGYPQLGVNPNAPGTPLQYCWSPNAVLPAISSNSSYGVQIPPNTYQSYGSWTNLIGSPKNGNWSLEISDDWAGDDGFVFQSTVSINSDSVVSVIDSVGSWMANSSIISPIVNTNQISFYSETAGFHDLVYYTLTNMGDTLFYHDTVIVLPFSYYHENYTICDGESVMIEGVNYTQEGFYIDTLMNTVGCDSIFSFDISIIDTFLKGKVFQSNGNPLKNSKIYQILFNPLDSTLKAIDSIFTNVQGYYEFSNAFSNFFLKVYPDTSLYPNEIPTYYSNSPVFQNADDLTLVCDTTYANFHTLNGINNIGNGFIGGFITKGAGKNLETLLPVINLEVLLIDNETLNVVQYAKTDQNGYFSFNNLDIIDYSIYVDKPFVNNDLAPSISLSQTEKQDGLEFILFSTYLQLQSYVNNNSIDISSSFNIFPNPTKKYLNATYNNGQTNIEFEIINLQGKSLLKRKTNSTFTLDLNKLNLVKGSYFLKVKSEIDSNCFIFIYK